jgi:hypothetical protein
LELQVALTHLSVLLEAQDHSADQHQHPALDLHQLLVAKVVQEGLVVKADSFRLAVQIHSLDQ